MSASDPQFSLAYKKLAKVADALCTETDPQAVFGALLYCSALLAANSKLPSGMFDKAASLAFKDAVENLEREQLQSEQRLN